MSRRSYQKRTKRGKQRKPLARDSHDPAGGKIHAGDRRPSDSRATGFVAA